MVVEARNLDLLFFISGCDKCPQTFGGLRHQLIVYAGSEYVSFSVAAVYQVMRSQMKPLDTYWCSTFGWHMPTVSRCCQLAMGAELELADDTCAWPSQSA